MNPEKSEVVVVGNIGLDTNVYLAGNEIDWQRETNFTENLDMLGQAGGYACRGYVRQDWGTAFIGYTGDDPPGAWVRAELTHEGVNADTLFIDPTGTSRSVNLVYPDGRRKNFYDGKSHMVLQPDLAQCAAAFEGARLAHFNIPNWARQLLPLARAAGAVIAVDLQDITTPDDPYRQDFLRAADFVFCSAANQVDPAVLITALQITNPQAVIVCGMGARGCALGSPQGIRFFPPFDMPGRPVVDTNGAGDALAVGFLCAHVLQGQSLETAIQFGQAAARYTCGARLSTEKVITRAQLQKLLPLII